jgi:uncharacterized membrane protein (DUF4010 family)
MNELETLERMGIALAIALLIGLERGWSERDLPEGRRVAGVRTFGLIGLVGAVAALLSDHFGGVVLGLGFVAIAIVLLFGQYLKFFEGKDIGVTTVTAGLLTFALGAVTMKGHLSLAVSIGVVTALLLGVKAELHSAIRRIDRQELFAVLKLLIMTVVLLPVLPHRGFGPWGALDPFEIWLMVVLICTLSFFGYIGIRLLGDRKGVLLAALAGSLVSSTAVTISLSRLPDRDRTQARLIGGAIILASSVMYARTLVVVSVFGLSLVKGLSIPLGLATIAGLIVSAILIRSAGPNKSQLGLVLRNPFDFWMALKFGLLLAVVIMFAQALNEWSGELGVFMAAGISGFVDVDAATLTVARMAPNQIPIVVGVGAILLATVTNTIFKATIAIFNSKGALLSPIFLGMGSQLLAILVGFLISNALTGFG